MHYLEFDYSDSSFTTEQIIERNAWLHNVPDVMLGSYGSIYLSSPQGQVIATLIALASYSPNHFLSFTTYTSDLAMDSAAAVSSKIVNVGGGFTTAAYANSLRSYSQMLRMAGLRFISSELPFDSDSVIEYSRLLLEYQFQWRHCVSPNDDPSEFNDMFIRKWLGICGVPMLHLNPLPVLCTH